MKRKTSQSRRVARTPHTEMVAVRRVSLVAPALRARKRPELVMQSTFSPLSRVAAGLLVAFFFFVPAADGFAATTEVIEAGDVFVAVSSSAVGTPLSGEGDAAVSSEAEAATLEVGVVEREESPASEVTAPSHDEVSVFDTASTTTPPLPAELPQGNEVEAVADEALPTVDSATGTSSHAGEGDILTTLPPDDVSASSTPPATEHADSVDAVITPPVDMPVVEVAIPTGVATSAESISIVATQTADGMVPGTHTTDADAFSFSQTECVPLGNGAFQCVRHEEGSRGAVAGNGEVYAQRDADGDLEVYLSVGVMPQQITQNNIDDDAPSVDRETGDVVWHAQIDDRSQIMQYNHKTGATTKLTKEAYNSMQPASFDGDVVFQSWIGNDWEIVLIDKNDGREILTDNALHDIAPSITQEYVMWQSFEGDTWVAKVYDRKSKEVQTVRGVEGGVVENPRMIMVFDNKKDNGDVETVGYDPASGEVIPLAVTPMHVPERIPAPAEEQEEKAMIGTTTTTRIETKSASSTGTGDDDEPTHSGVTSTPAVTEVSTDATTTPEVALEVVPVVAPDATAHIPDVVIPSFNSAHHEVASSTSE